jgi:hypothetical protein
MKPVVVIRPDAIIKGVSFQNHRGRLTAMRQDSRGRWRPIHWRNWPGTCFRSTVYIVEESW